MSLEKELFSCGFCGSRLDSEEEVIEKTCLDCINKNGTGWRSFFGRKILPRPR